MKKYYEILKNTKLFSGVEDGELDAMLNCLGARMKTYEKAEFVMCHGETAKNILILVEGSLLIQNDDYWGNRSLVGHVSVGETYGEAYAAPGCGAVQNDVVAAADSVVLLFDINRILSVCPNACKFHTLTVRNLFFSISEKNRRLIDKIGHMAKRTTREKLLSYLSEEAKRQDKSKFSIPYSRQELADYLSVDRSAMSNELSKLRDEGVLLFEKNNFELL